jgi:anti-sigma B factor antagonist
VGLEVTRDSREDVVVVELSGELDIYTVAGFKDGNADVDPAAFQVVIDLTEVSLVDSSGLGALVSLLNRARDGGREIGLVCPQRRLRRVFEIAGLRRAFVFGDDLDAVLAALAEGSRETGSRPG